MAQIVAIATASFGTNLAGGFVLGAGTAPTTSPADVVQQWVADLNGVAGDAALHLRTETGAVHVFGSKVGIGTVTPGSIFEVNAGIGVDADATATNARLLVYDVDSGALARVSVGANDSGGSGFKLLRIPN